MLEGLLNDEQTAEVLHRLSVSPEKLAAFRQHMALQGAFDRDSRTSEMTEEEDQAVWAALIGATGGVVTGGASAGASGWLGKAAAFIATGIAGFFIGTATDVDLSPGTASTPEIQQNTTQTAPAPVAAAAPGITRIDTVVKTVVQPQIIYRDRIVYRDKPAEQTLAAANSAPANQANTDPTLPSLKNGGAQSHNAAAVENAIAKPADEHFSSSVSSTQPKGLSAEEQQVLASLSSGKANATTPAANTSSAAKASTVPPNAEQAFPTNLDPNAALHNQITPRDLEERSSKSAESDSPSAPKNPASAVSFLKNGWEIAYNERIGRIAPAPAGLNEVDPSFGGRGIDLSYHLLDGRLGFGGRLIYGSFSRVTLEEEKWFALGEEETKFRPALGTEKGFGTELFINYRIPLFSQRLAIGTEIAMGAISTHSKVGGEISLLYLITNQLGAQVGAGYSRYFYNTTEIREEALNRFTNTGTTADLNNMYQGSMLEGRYGLFFRF